MTIAAAVDITASDQDGLIAAAAAFAQQRGEACYMIAIVRRIGDGERDIVERNLALITSRNASPVMQEGVNVARALASVAEKFGVGTLFVQNGRRRFGRSVAEELIHLKPPFQIVVVSRDSHAE
jgi:K+-sensing histidine kinase KdpD